MISEHNQTLTEWLLPLKSLQVLELVITNKEPAIRALIQLPIPLSRPLAAKSAISVVSVQPFTPRILRLPFTSRPSECDLEPKSGHGVGSNREKLPPKIHFEASFH